MTKAILVSIAALLLLWNIAAWCDLHAQVRDFAPYKFAELPDKSGLYKMVYQGCELFIAIDKGATGELSFKAYPKSVSVAVGRNCR